MGIGGLLVPTGLVSIKRVLGTGRISPEMSFLGRRGVRRSWMLIAVVVVSSGGACRAVGNVEEPTSEQVDACEVVLRRAVDDSLDREDVEFVHVLGSDSACTLAADRVARTPRVEPWMGSQRRRCPGRWCGPRDGNPLVVIHEEREGCFRMSELRFGGGSGVMRCPDEEDEGGLGGGAVVY